MKISSVLPLANPVQQLKLISARGSFAAQVATISKGIDQNTRLNLNEDVINHTETFPQEIHETPAKRAQRLLDVI